MWAGATNYGLFRYRWPFQSYAPTDGLPGSRVP